MCYSLEVSAFFLTVDVVLAAYLWFRDINTDRLWAVITMFPATVQFVDLMLWYEHRYDPDFKNGGCSSFNRWWTGLIISLVAMQPIVAYLGCLYYRCHSLGFKLRNVTFSDVFISLVPSSTIIILMLIREHDIDFNPCLTENPGMNYCSHITEDGHWLWEWGKDQWSTGLCSRKSLDYFTGVPWSREDPEFFAKGNRQADFPEFAKIIGSFIWSITVRGIQPTAGAVLMIGWAVLTGMLAIQTDSYGNMWCFLANSAGFVGILSPHILSLFGYDSNKVGQSVAAQAKLD